MTDNKHLTCVSFDDATDAILKLTRHTDPITGAIGVPVSRAMTFRTKTLAADDVLTRTYDGGTGYGVYRNPAWSALERITDYIEGGANSLVVSSGRAAIDLALRLLPQGSHIIVTPGDIYTGTRALFDLYGETTGLRVTYTDSTPEALQAAYVPGETRLVFAETITNPKLKIADLQAITEFAKRHDLLSIADNTAAPLLVRPLLHGFDVIASSLTKYISGNNDLSGGVVVFNTGRDDLAQKLRVWRDKIGATLSTNTAYELVCRAADFPQRLKKHCENAQKIAEALADDPRIARVYYPGLAQADDRDLALRYYQNFGGLVSFDLKGDRKTAARFLEALNRSEALAVADSFGSDWFLGYPAEQSGFYRQMSPEQRAAYGITDSFFRLATGRTRVEDTKQAILRALDAAFEAPYGTENGGTKKPVSTLLRHKS